MRLASGPCSRMTRVPCALVFHIESNGREGRFEFRAQARGDISALVHGAKLRCKLRRPVKPFVFLSFTSCTP